MEKALSLSAIPLKKKNAVARFFDHHSIGILSTPFVVLFLTFIIIPTVAAFALSFTYFNSIQTPTFNGLENYIQLLTNDETFMQKVLPNTIIFAIFVGAGGYILSFLMAWTLSQITHGMRTVLAMILYAPSMTSPALMAIIWQIVFNNDRCGYLNTILLQCGFISEPIQWLTSSSTLLPCMIVVSLWNSMGVGFLAMMAGVLGVNRELYEAAHIDGVKNRFQEIVYVTIPSVRPQMLFGAIMAIVGTFNNGSIGVTLSGTNPTPGNAGQLIATHIEDYGFVRYLMGYAACVSVVLLLLIWALSQLSKKLFSDKDEEGTV